MFKKKEVNIQEGRVDNFVRNTAVGIFMQLFSIILVFVNRTVFIKLLANDYLSINGLFSNILSTLSVIELGFGTALIYFMYKPVAEDNKEKIKIILKYYKRVYSIIGIIMITVGLLVIPFMSYIIKDAPVISENLNLIYILFLINTSIGYFFSHKVAIINAYQKNYVISIYNQLFKWVQVILQVVFLLITKNYMVYLIIQLLCTLFNYICISVKANKMFPFIKEKTDKYLSVSERKDVGNKVKSLIFYRLNPAILNGSDNIILSSFVGIKYVGIYSNYYLITNYLTMFLNQITSSLESSIGNLNAISSKEKKEEIFYKVLFLCFFVFGISCVLLMALINDFINIWIGEEYLFDNLIVFSILLYMYVNGVNFACYSFRTTTGLFEKAKLVPLFEVILNVGISIILAKYYGVAGVFLGTSIAKFLTFFWTDPKLLYNYLFEKKNMKLYFLKYLRYIFTVVVIGYIVCYLSSLVVVKNYFIWFVKAIILGILTVFMFIISTYRTEEFKGMMDIIKDKFLNKFIKRK